MNETDILKWKREQFHIEIRRNRIVKILNVKRKASNCDVQISNYYTLQMNDIGKIQLLDLLILINEKVNKPIIEMLQNDLGLQLTKLLNLNQHYSNWKLVKNLLILPDEHLYKYTKFDEMLIQFSQFFILLDVEIYRIGCCIKENDQNYQLNNIYNQQNPSYRICINKI